MLRQSDSRTPSFGGLVEHECPRCQRAVELPLGELCAGCRRELDRRARAIGRIISLASTVGLGAYVLLAVPPERTARLVGAAAVALWYLLTYRVVYRVAREFLR